MWTAITTILTAKTSLLINRISTSVVNFLTKMLLIDERILGNRCWKATKIMYGPYYKWRNQDYKYKFYSSSYPWSFLSWDCLYWKTCLILSLTEFQFRSGLQNFRKWSTSYDNKKLLKCTNDVVSSKHWHIRLPSQNNYLLLHQKSVKSV